MSTTSTTGKRGPWRFPEPPDGERLWSRALRSFGLVDAHARCGLPAAAAVVDEVARWSGYWDDFQCGGGLHTPHQAFLASERAAVTATTAAAVLQAGVPPAVEIVGDPGVRWTARVVACQQAAVDQIGGHGRWQVQLRAAGRALHQRPPGWPDDVEDALAAADEEGRRIMAALRAVRAGYEQTEVRGVLAVGDPVEWIEAFWAV